jgi:hypothetical protein
MVRQVVRMTAQEWKQLLEKCDSMKRTGMNEHPAFKAGWNAGLAAAQTEIIHAMEKDCIPESMRRLSLVNG